VNSLVPATYNWSAGNLVSSLQPPGVTTTSSSIRAADDPSGVGQYVSIANTMPSFNSTGCSNEWYRLILHETVPVGDIQALRLQRAQHRKLHHVHPDRLGVQAVIVQDTGQPAGIAALDPHLLRNGAAPAGNPGPPVLPVIPWREHLVRSGRRPDIPQDRLLSPASPGSNGTAYPGPSSRYE
jgi:hypothetical protein